MLVPSRADACRASQAARTRALRAGTVIQRAWSKIVIFAPFADSVCERAVQARACSGSADRHRSVGVTERQCSRLRRADEQQCSCRARTSRRAGYGTIRTLPIKEGIQLRARLPFPPSKLTKDICGRFLRLLARCDHPQLDRQPFVHARTDGVRRVTRRPGRSRRSAPSPPAGTQDPCLAGSRTRCACPPSRAR
jgi:hypothetical protein